MKGKITMKLGHKNFFLDTDLKRPEGWKKRPNFSKES